MDRHFEIRAMLNHGKENVSCILDITLINQKDENFKKTLYDNVTHFSSTVNPRLEVDL